MREHCEDLIRWDLKMEFPSPLHSPTSFRPQRQQTHRDVAAADGAGGRAFHVERVKIAIREDLHFICIALVNLNFDGEMSEKSECLRRQSRINI